MAGRVRLFPVRRRVGLGDRPKSPGLLGLPIPVLTDGGHDLSGHAETSDAVVGDDLVGDGAEERASALGLQRILGLGSYVTAWTWLNKLRRAMVGPGRDRLRVVQVHFRRSCAD